MSQQIEKSNVVHKHVYIIYVYLLSVCKTYTNSIIKYTTSNNNNNNNYFFFLFKVSSNDYNFYLYCCYIIVDR